MKKITLYLNDETMEALEKVAQSYDYYKYPINQAYGLIIDDLISEIQKLSLCSTRCCCAIPEHNHPPAWCIR